MKYVLPEYIMTALTLAKVDPCRFLTARELVSKSRDGASFKNLRVSHEQHQPPPVTRTGRILATIVISIGNHTVSSSIWN